MERILITGGTGYVGSYLTRKLVERGDEVHVLVKKESQLKRLASPCHVHVSTGKTEDILSIVKRSKPTTLFHLAAQTTTPLIEPMIQANILLGTQLLEASIKEGVKNFISTGSFWQGDANTYRPSCLYAATKQAFEEILIYYSDAHRISSLTLVLFDVYGSNDWRKKLFYQLERARKTREILKMSPGEQCLDLVYVDDVVNAYLQAQRFLDEKTEFLPYARYAISSGIRLTLKEVVALYEQLCGESLPIQWGGRPYRSREVMQPWMGTKLPGWEPMIRLEEGITRLLVEKQNSFSE